MSRCVVSMVRMRLRHRMKHAGVIMDYGSLTFAEAKWADGMSPGLLSFFASPEEWQEAGIRLGRAPALSDVTAW
jgi:hypothetical protein